MVYLKQMEKSQEQMIENLYNEAFPEIERKPFSMLLKLRKKKKADLFVIHDENTDEAVGLAFMLVRKEFVLFDYFAIMPQFRSKGYGSSVLEAIKKRYEGKLLFGEVEPIDDNADNNEQRIRRIDFYLRNGFKMTGTKVSLFGCVLELMYYGDRAVTFEEYHKFLECIFGIRGRGLVRKNVFLVNTED